MPAAGPATTGGDGNLLAPGGIIFPMRHCLLVLLIALLPLRGWAADTMAVQGVENFAKHAISIAESDHSTLGMAEYPAISAAADGHGPCHDALAASEGGEPDGHHTSTCGTCQICHLAVLLQPLLAAADTALPDAQPAFRAGGHRSTLPGPQLKPPIA